MASRPRYQPGLAAAWRASLGLLRRYAILLAALLPLLFLLLVVVRFAVGVPFLDHWELVPVLEKSYAGTLSFADLWAQHNEHRILFPRLIMLALARASDWNTHLELEVNIVLGLGILVVYALQVESTARELRHPALTWAIPLASLVVFSVTQYENWLWGWELQFFLNLFCVVAGVLVLANGVFSWKRLAGSAAFGVGATYAFANGPLFWPIGLLVLIAVAKAGRQRQVAVGVWLLIAALVLGANYLGYRKPGHHPPLGLVFKMPGEYATYVLKYLGSTGVPGSFRRLPAHGAQAAAVGVAGALAFAWALWRLLRTTTIAFRTLLPYLAMSLYSLGSALATGVGRLGMGTNQALSSRYCTMVTPFWVSLLVLLMLLARDTARDTAARSPRTREFVRARRRRDVARGLLWGFVALLAFASGSAVARAREFSEHLDRGRALLLNRVLHPRDANDVNALSALYPWPDILWERTQVLVKHRLSLFRGLK
jgi:hypothetical protein